MSKLFTFILILLILMPPTLANPKKILFIHHSTGGNLIKEGNLRSELSKIDSSIEFWDHNYNLSPIFTKFLAARTHLKGLSDQNGTVTGTDYNIYLSNNSPKEFAEIFARDPKDPTLKEILNYDVIAFKNCYPTTRITTERQLEDDIRYFNSIRESISKYPTKHFILITPPPARKSTTTLQNAARAKKLVTYLTSQEYVQNIPSLHVFDFFTLLSDDNGFLKREYERPLFWDSHPNKQANLDVARQFSQVIYKVLNNSL